MPDVNYKIEYTAPPDKAIRGIDSMEARLLKFEAVIDRVAGKMKGLGSNLSGLAKMTQGVQQVQAAMKALEAEAARAERVLAGVGKGNSSVAGLTGKLGSLNAALAQVAASAASAQAGLGGLGGGVKVPGAGGGGGGGGAGGIKGRLAGIGKAAARHAGYLAARKGVQAVGDAAAGQREFFGHAADLASDYRSDLGELAVLKGKKNGADESLIRDDLNFQRSTLLKPDDSRAFRLEFGGAVDASLKANGGKNINQDTADELEREAGKFTARYGLDPVTGGRMAGLLGVTQRVPDAKTGLGIMAETMEQLNVAGVGSVRSLAAQMSQLSGGMLASVNDDSEGGQAGGGGRFKSYPEMAARFAASTVNSFGKSHVAKTRIIQSDRLLRKFNGKEEEAFLRKVGITPEDDYETAINKIAPHVTGPDGDRTLMAAGFGNSTERLAVIEEAKLNATVKKNVADPRMVKARVEASADNQAFAQSTTGRQQAAETEEFAATIEAGLKGEGLKGARARARAKMIREGTLKAGPLTGLTDAAKSFYQSAGGVSGEDLRVDFEAVQELRAEGRKVGIDVDREFPQLNEAGGVLPGSAADQEGFSAEFGRAAGRIDAAKAAKKAGAALNQLGDALNQAKGGGPGQAPPVGDGGGGVVPGRR